MDVAALRSKVTFQKNETVTDKYGIIRMPGQIITHALRQSAAKVWQVPRKSRLPALRLRKYL